MAAEGRRLGGDYPLPSVMEYCRDSWGVPVTALAGAGGRGSGMTCCRKLPRPFTEAVVEVDGYLEGPAGASAMGVG
jgi:hypothetical protein